MRSVSRKQKMRAVEKVASCDPIWSALRAQAEQLAESEPELASIAHATILKHDSLEEALSYLLAKKIGGEDLSPMQLREMFQDAFAAEPAMGEAVRADLSAVFQRDPACHSYVQAFLFFKGFHALESYRVAHFLWNQGRKLVAFFIQNRMSDLFAVDIHPAAQLGRGIGRAEGGPAAYDGGGRSRTRHRKSGIGAPVSRYGSRSAGKRFSDLRRS